MLAQDSRLREELVLNLIRTDELSPSLMEWAQRLGIDLNTPRVVAVVEVDSCQLGVDSAMAELQQLQTLLATPERNNLIAIVSLTEMVVLKPARTTMGVGKQRMPSQRCYYYQDLMLPVLLDSLRGGWQANELVRPLAKLKAMDGNGLLRRTLNAWFRNNVQPGATSKALFIDRNTLEYRLNRIFELTGLDLGNFDDRLLLYVALQLDEEE